ncbi:MAG: 30S ribosomal protein S18 [Candidatus Omnitrophica bacterium]|nr:30S ribosomal protein S18 [Candidatus Omnitrophota bacterium]
MGSRGTRARKKRVTRYLIPKDAEVEYKNLTLLQKYVTDRGKIVSRRVSGVNAKEQRDLTRAIKRARYLGLLPVGGVKKK